MSALSYGNACARLILVILLFQISGVLTVCVSYDERWSGTELYKCEDVSFGHLNKFINAHAKDSQVNLVLEKVDLLPLKEKSLNEFIYNNVVELKIDNCKMNFGLYPTQKFTHIEKLTLKRSIVQNFTGSLLTNFYTESTRYLKIEDNFTPVIYDLCDQDFNAKTLILVRNSIEILEGAFKGCNKLRHLDLSSNLIMKIPNDTFKKLKNLYELNLSGNQLVDFELYSNTIKILNLSYNFITSLDISLIMHELPSLVNLDMSFNGIRTVWSNKYKSNDINLETLLLSNNKISELEVDTFICCPNLKKLDLSNNPLKIHPFIFNGIDKLRELYLGNTATVLNDNMFRGLLVQNLNFESGNINKIHPLAFQNAVDINSIKFQDNKIDDIPDNLFEDLKNLTHLYLCHNRIRTFSRNIFGSSNLNNNNNNILMLDLYGNEIVEITVGMFKNLINLLSLDLSNNLIEHIEEGSFATLKKLTDLFLSSNKINKITNGMFEGLTSLVYLSLPNSEIETLEKDSFKGLYSLELLNISNNRIAIISPNIFLHNPRILHINFSSNPLKSMDPFGNMLTLEILDLKSTKVVFDPQILETTNKITSLYLSNTSLQEIKKDSFSKVLNLKLLDLSFNYMEYIPCNISSVNLEKLLSLDLSHNKILQMEVCTFIFFPNLTNLYLQYNLLNNLEIGIFSPLINLRQLNLSNNKLENLNENLFYPLVRLEELDMSSNNLMTIDMFIFSHMSSLSYVDLNNNSLVCANLTILLKDLENKKVQVGIETNRIFDSQNVNGFNCQISNSTNNSLAEEFIKQILQHHEDFVNQLNKELHDTLNEKPESNHTLGSFLKFLLSKHKSSINGNGTATNIYKLNVESQDYLIFYLKLLNIILLSIMVATFLVVCGYFVCKTKCRCSNRQRNNIRGTDVKMNMSDTISPTSSSKKSSFTDLRTISSSDFRHSKARVSEAPRNFY